MLSPSEATTQLLSDSQYWSLYSFTIAITVKQSKSIKSIKAQMVWQNTLTEQSHIISFIFTACILNMLLSALLKVNCEEKICYIWWWVDFQNLVD